MSTEWRAPHVAGCQAEPVDDQRPGVFCVGCAFERQVERQAELRAFAAFQRLTTRWFPGLSWGRG